MLPTSPVIPGVESDADLPLGTVAVVYAEGQPEYIPLPSIRTIGGQVTSRWTPTPEERERIAAGADILLTLHTFNHPLQPIQMQLVELDFQPTAESIAALLGIAP